MEKACGNCNFKCKTSKPDSGTTTIHSAQLQNSWKAAQLKKGKKEVGL